MAPKDKTDFKTKIFSSSLFLFLILLLFIGLVIAVVNIGYKKYLLNKEVKNLKERVEKIDRESVDLEKAIEYQKTPEFLEKEMRRKLNLKKEGENVIIVPSSNTSNKN